MKNFIVLIVLAIPPFFCNAQSSGELNRCSSVMLLGATVAQMSLKSAPPYARDKYEKQTQFFFQGNLNLKKKARASLSYVGDKAFEDSSFEGLKDMQKQIHDGLLSTEAVNQSLRDCMSMAGLNFADYPR
jgi:hypothetical protein